MTRYIFNDAYYATEEEVNDAIIDYIYETYPEIVHSDFLPEESVEFEDLWETVDVLEYSNIYAVYFHDLSLDVQKEIAKFMGFDSVEAYKASNKSDLLTAIGEVKLGDDT